MSQPDLAQHQLGTILDGKQPRDAVHIALFSAQCAHRLGPGDWVKLHHDGSLMRCEPENAIGIVDPFLPVMAQPDHWVYVFLKPNTVTGLRHVYEHPTLDGMEGRTPYETVKRIAELLDIGQDHLMQAARTWRESSGEEWPTHEVQLGSEGWRDEFRHYAKEFWQAYAQITGDDTAEMDDNFFSCSC